MARLLQITEPGQTPEPHAEAPSLAVGIDLGTTHTLVAYSQAGVPQVLGTTPLIPSVVFYPTEGEPVVGQQAQEALGQSPELGVRSIKRLMGKGFKDLKGKNSFSAQDLLSSSSEEGIVRLQLGQRILTPVEISAHILAHAKKVAENQLGAPLRKAVITVPAYFDDAARTATKDAALLAGLEVLRLLNEPTAAALAYGLDQNAEGIYAIYDLGGGTFDLSILKLEQGVFQVLATGGDTQLGGDDFDQAILEDLVHYQSQGNFSQLELKALLPIARKIKEALTTEQGYEWLFKTTEKSLAGKFTRVQLNKLTLPYIDRTLTICKQVLADAELTPTQINGVVLVGGSTRLPLVQEKVQEFFGQPPLCTLDPDQAVALGAALQAEALTQGSQNLLLDVTPLSLGIETMGGLVEKIIPRNTPIPVVKKQDFTTYQDGQTAMKIHVVQGEHEHIDHCRSLAQFELRGIPPQAAGAARIEVTFAVDADGLLRVSARDHTSGQEQRVEVKPSYGLTEQELRKMLMASEEF